MRFYHTKYLMSGPLCFKDAGGSQLLKKLSVFVLLLHTIVTAYPQQYPVKHTVTLDDGSRFTGIIILDSADQLVMKVTKPSRIILNRGHVVSITEKEKYQRIKMRATDFHGYNISISAGIMPGKSESGKELSVSINAENGYRFRNGIYAGVGTGIEGFDVVVLPLYAGLSYYPFNSGVSPFAWMKCGYSFSVSDFDSGYYYNYNGDGTNGGLMFSAGLGSAVYSWRGNAVFLGAGYRYQRVVCTQKEYYYWRQDASREIITDYNRFEIRLGFIFR